MQKIIWTTWFGGRESAPGLVDACIGSWERRNPGWQVRCLDSNSIGRYVDISSHVDLAAQQISPRSLSEIACALLLHEFGGVWVDATLFCNRPLDEWLQSAAATGFFAFSGPSPDRPITSWLVSAASGNRLLSQWAARAIRYWDGRVAADRPDWFVRQFADTCLYDDDALKAWAAVPKISAAAALSLESSSMAYEQFHCYADDVDWASPVFKLDGDVIPRGTLLDKVLSGDTAEKFATSTGGTDNPTGAGVKVTRVAGLKVSTDNLGDHIQLLGAYRLLGRVGVSPDPLLDRDDEIASAAALDPVPGPVGILMSGWHKFAPTEWPPHPKLHPIYLGFHIRLFQSPTLIAPPAIAHYRKFGPIGCRDPYTAALLKQKGVDAFVSLCLSLLFEKRLPATATQVKTFIVSRDRRIYDHVLARTGPARFVTHYSGTRDFHENMRVAAELLDSYRQEARVIVTTMLHCALPAIAMGIPVVVIYPFSKRNVHASDRERFSALEQLVPIFSPADLDDIDWNGYTADVSGVKLKLLDDFYRMAGRWSLPESAQIQPSAPPDLTPTLDVNDFRTHVSLKTRFLDRFYSIANKWRSGRS